MTLAIVFKVSVTRGSVQGILPAQMSRYDCGPSLESRICSKRLSDSHLSLSPRANGVIPFALRAAATVKNSSQVVGAWSLLSAKIFLLNHSTPLRWTFTGTEYMSPLLLTRSMSCFGHLSIKPL